MVYTVLCILKSDGKTVGYRVRHTSGEVSEIDVEKAVIGYKAGVRFTNAVLRGNYLCGKGCKLPIESVKKEYITLYHGSKDKVVVPKFGYGEDKHDYGRGFYLTRYPELAKEWAVAVSAVGYLHEFKLYTEGLTVFNFNNVSPLCWLAELMSHRAADNSARYKKFSKEFIDRYKIDISHYDVICGWRADSSYFSIAKRFIRDEIDYTLISELFRLGDLENQFCIKSKKAFRSLEPVGNPVNVDSRYSELYNKRDSNARNLMNVLIESERNTMTKGFSYVMKEGIDL